MASTGALNGRATTWLRPQQVERLRDACYDDRFQPAYHQRNETIVALLYDAGLRVGELVELDVESLDFVHGTLSVPSREGASGTGSTTLDLDPTGSLGTVRLLKSYLYNRTTDTSVLFPSRKGDRLTPKAVRDVVGKVADAAGVDPHTAEGERGDPADVSPHTLRHGAAWRLLDDGRTMDDVRRRLRHTSVQTTERVYGHFRVAPSARATGRYGDEFGEHGLIDVLNRLGDGIYAFDTEGRPLWWNDRWEGMTGYTATEIAERDPLEFLVPDDRRTVRRLLGDVETEHAITPELTLQRKDGSTLAVEANGTRITDDEGEVTAHIGVVRDISGRKENEQLRRERNLTHQILETSPVGIAVFSDEAEIVRHNSHAAAIMGYEGEDVTGMSYDDVAWTGYDADGNRIPAAESPISRVIGTGSPLRDFEMRLECSERGSSWLSLNAMPILAADGSVSRVVATLEDVTERKEREQELEGYKRIVETISDGVYRLDSDLRFTMVNDALVSMSGYPRERFIGSDNSFLTSQDKEETGEALRRQMLAGERDVATMTDELQTASGDTIPVETRFALVPTDDEFRGTVGVVRDITERREYERMLTALHDSTRELMQAETREEVAELVVDTATDVLDLSGVVVHLHDEEDDVLRPAAYALGSGPRHEPSCVPAEDSSILGHVFTTGETTVVDDIPNSEHLRTPTHIRSGLFIPLGEHGMFMAASMNPTTFDERMIELIDLFAASAEAALDRVTREAQLRERGRTLARQRDELETLTRINALIQEVRRDLMGAATRDEIERTVCRRLADSEFYDVAWTAEIERCEESLVGREGAGIDDEHLERIVAAVGEGSADRKAVVAARTGETQVVHDIDRDSNLAEPIRSAARDYGVRSAVAVPIANQHTVFGVLVVGAPRPMAFSERERSAFRLLGDTMGFAIGAIRNERLLLTDSVVELEFQGPATGDFFVQLSSRLDCTCTLDGIVPGQENQLLHYVSVEGTSPDSFLELVEESDQITAYRLIDARDDGFRIEVEMPTSAPKALMDAGTNVRTASATNGVVRLVAEAPVDADVRSIADTVQSSYPALELTGKQTIDRPVKTTDEFRQTVDGEFTDKQRAALRAAFHAGYYDWPRGSTAEEIAESVGVASPTLHQHLRRSHQKLLEAFFGMDEE